MDVAALVEGVLAGDRRAIARAISAVEDDAPELAELSAGIYPETGRSEHDRPDRRPGGRQVHARR